MRNPVELFGALRSTAILLSSLNAARSALWCRAAELDLEPDQDFGSDAHEAAARALEDIIADAVGNLADASVELEDSGAMNLLHQCSEGIAGRDTVLDAMGAS